MRAPLWFVCISNETHSPAVSTWSIKLVPWYGYLSQTDSPDKRQNGTRKAFRASVLPPWSRQHSEAEQTFKSVETPNTLLIHSFIYLFLLIRNIQETHGMKGRSLNLKWAFTVTLLLYPSAVRLQWTLTYWNMRVCKRAWKCVCFCLKVNRGNSAKCKIKPNTVKVKMLWAAELHAELRVSGACH